MDDLSITYDLSFTNDLSATHILSIARFSWLHPIFIKRTQTLRPGVDAESHLHSSRSAYRLPSEPRYKQRKQVSSWYSKLKAQINWTMVTDTAEHECPHATTRLTLENMTN